jgi:hypothetical protein
VSAWLLNSSVTGLSEVANWNPDPVSLRQWLESTPAPMIPPGRFSQQWLLTNAKFIHPADLPALGQELQARKWSLDDIESRVQPHLLRAENERIRILLSGAKSEKDRQRLMEESAFRSAALLSFTSATNSDWTLPREPATTQFWAEEPAGVIPEGVPPSTEEAPTPDSDLRMTNQARAVRNPRASTSESDRPPGFYPDPKVGGFVRYWDGIAWANVNRLADT